MLQKGRFLLRLFIRDKWHSPRYSKNITESFFSTVNLTGFPVSLLSRHCLKQLSTNLIGNAFFPNVSFNWHFSGWNPEKFKTSENFGNNKVKIKPALYSPEMKLLKLQYTPLNLGFWNTDALKPLLVLAIKTRRQLLLLFLELLFSEQFSVHL